MRCQEHGRFTLSTLNSPKTIVFLPKKDRKFAVGIEIYEVFTEQSQRKIYNERTNQEYVCQACAAV